MAVPPLFRGCTGAVSVLARGLTEGGEPGTDHLGLLGVPVAALVAGAESSKTCLSSASRRPAR
jgi:hypothetical protein